MGHRTYLGAGVATIDNGRVVDAATVIPITDPRHLLHWRHDPQRYSLENQGFKALVDWIVDNGPVPQPVMFRRRGLLTSEEPELTYIRKVYPDAAQQHPEQPRLELVYGNRRWHALIEARRIWAERRDESKTRSKARMLAVYAQLDDKDMEDAFVRENSQLATRKDQHLRRPAHGPRSAAPQRNLARDCQAAHSAREGAAPLA
jgi:hypothetical protein